MLKILTPVDKSVRSGQQEVQMKQLQFLLTDNRPTKANAEYRHLPARLAALIFDGIWFMVPSQH